MFDPYPLQSDRCMITASQSTVVRLAALAMLLAVAGTGYHLLLHESAVGDLPQERTLNSPLPGELRVHLYLELVSVDAVRDAMQVRVSVQPAGDAFTLPDHDLALVLAHGREEERIDIPAHKPPLTTTAELDLDGDDINNYPLDAYRASLAIRSFETSPALAGSAPKLLPVDLTIWERVLGFRLRAERVPGGPDGEERLTFSIRRSRAFVVFAVAAYGAMLILACGALTIGLLVAFRVRRAEPTLVSALGAIVFALPALRAALPASPPLGVSADVLVFLWAEMAAVLALLLLVATWARTGPRP